MSTMKRHLYLGGPRDGIDGRLEWRNPRQDRQENDALLGNSGHYERREPRMFKGEWVEEVREWVRDTNPPLPYKEPEIDGTRDWSQYNEWLPP